MGYTILVWSVGHYARKFAWTGPFRNTVRVGLDCSRGMERTVQVLAVRWLLKQSSDIQPGHQARTCPLNRQGKAEAAHPHARFSKGYSSTAPCTPLQHLWGGKTHTKVCLHTRTHVHAHMHTCMRTCAHIQQTQTHAHKHTDTREHT
jgi:hypothetical protein